MDEKYSTLSNNSTSTDNKSLVSNYNFIVQEKISKELLDPVLLEHCEDCPHNKAIPILENEYKKSVVLVESNGILGTHICENNKKLSLKLSDNVIIKIDKEFEYAIVIETGKMVNFRSIKHNHGVEILPLIERVVNEKDKERYETNLKNSSEAKEVFIDLTKTLNLEMKLVDVHLQFDRKKMFFFYTADGRVDFRELAKKLAAHFKTRIELRQIGVRDEAKRIGGVATCGREFCCATFMHNFKRITTDIAIENNISTSISKYTGPCGKLKCCLSFEL